ncbi:cell division protein FtsH, partial [mine drainage metagenome]
MPRLLKHDVQVTQAPADGGNILVKILIDWVPLLLIFGALFWFMRQMQSGGGGRGAMSFGRSRAKLQGEDQVKVTFADVAGCEEAKDDLRELVDFLKDPAKFQKLGGRIPRGVLLAGSPGTGKTLLA